MNNNTAIKTITEINNEPVIILTGLELEKFGFELNDMICIEIIKDQIIISKNEKTKTLQKLERKNPSVKKMIVDFGLVVNL